MLCLIKVSRQGLMHMAEPCTRSLCGNVLESFMLLEKNTSLHMTFLFNMQWFSSWDVWNRKRGSCAFWRPSLYSILARCKTFESEIAEKAWMFYVRLEAFVEWTWFICILTIYKYSKQPSYNWELVLWLLKKKKQPSILFSINYTKRVYCANLISRKKNKGH